MEHQTPLASNATQRLSDALHDLLTDFLMDLLRGIINPSECDPDILALMAVHISSSTTFKPVLNAAEQLALAGFISSDAFEHWLDAYAENGSGSDFNMGVFWEILGWEQEAANVLVGEQTLGCVVDVSLFAEIQALMRMKRALQVEGSRGTTNDIVKAVRQETTADEVNESESRALSALDGRPRIEHPGHEIFQAPVSSTESMPLSPPQQSDIFDITKKDVFPESEITNHSLIINTPDTSKINGNNEETRSRPLSTPLGNAKSAPPISNTQKAAPLSITENPEKHIFQPRPEINCHGLSLDASDATKFNGTGEETRPRPLSAPLSNTNKEAPMSSSTGNISTETTPMEVSERIVSDGSSYIRIQQLEPNHSLVIDIPTHVAQEAVPSKPESRSSSASVFLAIFLGIIPVICSQFISLYRVYTTLSSYIRNARSIWSLLRGVAGTSYNWINQIKGGTFLVAQDTYNWIKNGINAVRRWILEASYQTEFPNLQPVGQDKETKIKVNDTDTNIHPFTTEFVNAALGGSSATTSSRSKKLSKYTTYTLPHELQEDSSCQALVSHGSGTDSSSTEMRSASTDVDIREARTSVETLTVLEAASSHTSATALSADIPTQSTSSLATVASAGNPGTKGHHTHAASYYTVPSLLLPVLGLLLVACGVIYVHRFVAAERDNDDYDNGEDDVDKDDGNPNPQIPIGSDNNNADDDIEGEVEREGQSNASEMENETDEENESQLEKSYDSSTNEWESFKAHGNTLVNAYLHNFPQPHSSTAFGAASGVTGFLSNFVFPGGGSGEEDMVPGMPTNKDEGMKGSRSIDDMTNSNLKFEPTDAEARGGFDSATESKILDDATHTRLPQSDTSDTDSNASGGNEFGLNSDNILKPDHNPLSPQAQATVGSDSDHHHSPSRPTSGAVDFPAPRGTSRSGPSTEEPTMPTSSSGSGSDSVAESHKGSPSGLDPTSCPSPAADDIGTGPGTHSPSPSLMHHSSGDSPDNPSRSTVNHRVKDLVSGFEGWTFSEKS